MWRWCVKIFSRFEGNLHVHVRKIAASLWSVPTTKTLTFATSLSIASICTSFLLKSSLSESPDESQQFKKLSRNFVADAVSVAAPSVVNIRCSRGGFFGAESAGSGFIMSQV